jgi:hypothetical protein
VQVIMSREPGVQSAFEQLAHAGVAVIVRPAIAGKNIPRQNVQRIQHLVPWRDMRD